MTMTMSIGRYFNPIQKYGNKREKLFDIHLPHKTFIRNCRFPKKALQNHKNSFSFS